MSRMKSRMTLEYEARMRRQPAVTRCALCDWTFEGTVADGADRARSHREMCHPERAGERPDFRRAYAQRVQAEKREAEKAARAARAASVTRTSAPARPAPAAPRTRRRVSPPPTPPPFVERWTRAEIISAIRAWADEHGHAPTQVEWITPAAARPSFKTAARVFGSWSTAITEAGLEPRRRGPKHGSSGRKLDYGEARRLYAEGQTILQIGALFGVHPSTVWSAVKGATSTRPA